MTGHEFRWRRVRLGLRQQDLAEHLQCTRQWIGTLEKRPDVPSIYALALMQLETQRGRMNAAA